MNLEYSFIKADKNNDFIVFIKVDPEFLNQEINFGVKDNKFLIEFNNNKLESEIINQELLDKMQHNSVPVLFTDKDGEFLFEIYLNPILSSKKVKP